MVGVSYQNTLKKFNNTTLGERYGKRSGLISRERNLFIGSNPAKPAKLEADMIRDLERRLNRRASASPR